MFNVIVEVRASSLRLLGLFSNGLYHCDQSLVGLKGTAYESHGVLERSDKKVQNTLTLGFKHKRLMPDAGELSLVNINLL
jgi:hypothetical protein